MKNRPSRYQQLLTLIDLLAPQNILEIGTWNGINAVNMMQAARKHNAEATYIGYDLFEEANETTDKEEFNVKPHFKAQDVQDFIHKNTENVNIILTKGNTRETLKDPVRADLAFIDGGHSIETIESDYEAVKDSSIIVFDDYYTPDEAGRCPDINEMGCNKLVDSLGNVVLLPRKDPVSGGGYTQFAMMVNK